MDKLKAFLLKYKTAIACLVLCVTALAVSFALFYLLMGRGIDVRWAHAVSCVSAVLAALGVYVASLLFKKYREAIAYLFFGVLTTVVSFALYYALLWLGLHYLWAQTISWVGAVLFAYVTNKRYVFESRAHGFFPVLFEFCSFVLSRLFSFGVETLLLWLMVDIATVSETVAKIPVAVLTVILNYVTGKLLVFRKKSDGDTTNSQK